jgi:putative acetyltransferase
VRLRVARPAEGPRLARLAGAPETALDGRHVALAEDAAGVAGIMGLSPSGRLDPLWIAPGDRGRTAATALHDAIEAEALRGGIAVLSTRIDSALRPFLEQRGWRAVAEKGGRTAMERRAGGRE